MRRAGVQSPALRSVEKKRPIFEGEEVLGLHSLRRPAHVLVVLPYVDLTLAR
jgi:hypothetical protein